MTFPFDQSRVQIIAEACDNHMGSLDSAVEMCNQAKLAGADFIKFQHHLPDAEMLRDSPMSDNFDEPLYDFLEKNALSIHDHKQLISHCNDIGIQYLCTPFSWQAAEELDRLGVLMFKIGSGELRDLPTLKKIASFGKPMILSTGMATFDEIKDTANFLKDLGAEFAFLNCLSEYPPKYEDMNISFIHKLQAEFPEVIVGHSDHAPDLYTSYAAVALGAKIIEKHVILDKKTPGPDQSVSIDFFDLKQLVDGVRKIELSLGSSKKVRDKEKSIREWAYRSIVTTKDLNPGDVITEENICTKRPGTGIPACEYFNILGKVVLNSVKENTILSLNDIES